MHSRSKPSTPHEVGCPPPYLSMLGLGFSWLGTAYKVKFREAGSSVVEDAGEVVRFEVVCVGDG